MSVPLILHPKYAETPTSSQDFYLALEGAHSIFGATVAQRWGMPEEVVMSIANHGQLLQTGPSACTRAPWFSLKHWHKRWGTSLKALRGVQEMPLTPQ